MTEWHRLTDADGAADDVPALLAQLEPEGPVGGWSALWNRLYNQGTVYSASYAALPELLALAEAWPAESRGVPLGLAGAIVAGEDFAPGAEQYRRHFLATVPKLAELAELTLSSSRLFGEPETYICLLQALLAFNGDRVWGRLLGGLADEEYESECPACRTPLVVALREDDRTSTVHDFVARATDAPLPLRAEEPAQLAHPGRTLHDRACLDHQQTVADRLTYVFGHATCPRCRTEFRVSDAITGG